tara:strand:- start:190 stop:372 length:183 start_codon:yes stop_codon:yes gene_type:complete
MFENTLKYRGALPRPLLATTRERGTGMNGDGGQHYKRGKGEKGKFANFTAQENKRDAREG